MVHMRILKKCGDELEHALRSRCIEPCSTEEYINALEDIVTRTKIGETWKKLDIKSPNKPFIKKRINQKKLSSTINPTIMSKENAIKVEVLDTYPITASRRKKSMKLWKQKTTMTKKRNLTLKKRQKSQKLLKVMKLI
ncbi:hypothetical protein O181_057906 [Austropuccinia psidii MF-1]|uniref:Uncharacterized protein n=1 Tax=Austropuccinia psidii MF-1 TaxID=1389203 RepID=A0A9Q3E975_9BASI|nr:hypothetical protein [Austropuccinia psidii MF-1]